MSTADDKLAEESMAVVNQIDEKVQEPGQEELRDAWVEGDFDTAYGKIKEMYPEVTEEQWNWIEDFLSEM